jgi:hypothetical protein
MKFKVNDVVMLDKEYIKNSSCYYEFKSWASENYGKEFVISDLYENSYCIIYDVCKKWYIREEALKISTRYLVKGIIDSIVDEKE